MDSLQKHVEILSRSPLWAIDFAALSAAIRADKTWCAARPSMMGRGQSKVGIIPVKGVLTSDGPDWLGSNYGSISDAVEQAAADPTVKRIVLSVDSPGGEVVGLQETAGVIAQAAKVKPVSAIVEGMSASAAYWLSSQAHDIALTPSGQVGSVGVRMMHMDISKMLEDAGVKVTELQAGQFKTEWSPYKPLSDDAKAEMQKRLEDTQQDFIGAIRSGRGNRMSLAMRRGNFGEGRMFSAKDALSHGFVDRIESPRTVYRAMAQETEAARPTSVRAARVALAKTNF